MTNAEKTAAARTRLSMRPPFIPHASHVAAGSATGIPPGLRNRRECLSLVPMKRLLTGALLALCTGLSHAQMSVPVQNPGALRRAAGQGRGLGADAAGSGRAHARHGGGHGEGLRDRPRLGRRAQRDRRREARRARAGRGVRRRTWCSCRGATPRPPAWAIAARFVEADMYSFDISQATVLALFLLPENLVKLKPKFDEAQARHAHRQQRLPDPGLGGERDRRGRRRLRAVVHRLPVHRAARAGRSVSRAASAARAA